MSEYFPSNCKWIRHINDLNGTKLKISTDLCWFLEYQLGALRECTELTQILTRCTQWKRDSILFFQLYPSSRQSHFHIHVQHSILIYLYVVYLNLKYAIAMRIGIIVAVTVHRLFSVLCRLMFSYIFTFSIEKSEKLTRKREKALNAHWKKAKKKTASTQNEKQHK